MALKLTGKDIAIIIVAVIGFAGTVITVISGNREIKKEIEWMKYSIIKTDKVVDSIYEYLMDKDK